MMLDGLRNRGIAVCADSRDCDAAIIWSVLWNGRMQANQQVYRHYRSQGKPVIIVEIGALHRGLTWKVAVNNITSAGYYGHLENLDWDRPTKLNVKLAKSVPARPHVVIALQHTKSLQVAEQPASWLVDTIQQIKNNTDRPIAIRQHPRCKVAVPGGIEVENPKPIAGTYDSFDMQFDCHAVVNYNSGPGIQAAIAGARPVVDASSLAHSVGIDFASIEKPYNVDRELWLRQICHTEYTIEELKQGLWLTRIASVL